MDSRSILLGFYGFYVDFTRFLWILGRFYWVFIDSRSIFKINIESTLNRSYGAIWEATAAETRLNRKPAQLAFE